MLPPLRPVVLAVSVTEEPLCTTVGETVHVVVVEISRLDEPSLIVS
jgi:hypothetical protein